MSIVCESVIMQSESHTLPDDALAVYIKGSDWPTSVFGGDQPALTYSPLLRLEFLQLKYMFDLRWMTVDPVPLEVWSNLKDLRVKKGSLELRSIANLTQLRTLRLDQVRYPLTGKGNLDVFLHTFTLLENLYLDWLPRCPVHLPLSLRTLVLGVSHGVDDYEVPMELSLLTNLTELSLSGGNFTGIPFDLGKCYPRLSFLSLDMYMCDRAPTFRPLGLHPLHTLELWCYIKDPLPATFLQLKKLGGSCGFFEWKRRLTPLKGGARIITETHQRPPSLLECSSRFVILTLYPTDLTPKIIEVG